MKQHWLRFFVIAMAAALLAPVSLLAQKDDKTDKKDEEKDKKETQQIIITRKSTNDDKVTIEIKGDKVTVNGKTVEGKDGDITVKVNRWKDMSYLRTPRAIGRNGGATNYEMFFEDANKAMLGVTTESTEGGVEVQSVTKESAAEKAGLKEKDIITKIDDQKIEDPDDLSSVIQKHKAGDKVSVSFLRDKKEQKVTAELTKWKGMTAWTTDGNNFKFDMNDISRYLPKTPMVVPHMTWSGNGPRLGLSIQDNEDGKGAKVVDVDEESNAFKAGIREDDIITEADGKTINNTDDMVKVIRESKEKNSIMLKIQRAGKTQNVEVKMPRRIKTADL
jgi:serine protease Do